MQNFAPKQVLNTLSSWDIDENEKWSRNVTPE